MLLSALTLWSFFDKLFDTSDFPARWYCGRWTSAHGWLYILSDLAIFGAYMAIPLLMAYFLLQRKELPFPRVLWLFIAFILACGFTHLIDAVIFWHPIYRISALARFATALVSWATVFALIPNIPRVLTLKTPQQLEAQVAQRTAELRATEQKLREVQEHLEQRVAARTAALQTSNDDLQQFAYIVSHDLKEPIRMISMFTDLLREDYGEQLDDEGRDYLERAHEGALRMKRQLAAVLRYSRVQSEGAPFSAVSLAAVLDDALADLHLSITETGATITAEPTVLPTVRGDAEQLRQVLTNLIANAIKFAHPDRPPEIVVRAERGETEWAISVEDNGTGFDTKHADRIFQIFHRLDTERSSPGSGVGLAICKRIVSRHGGQIRVSSRHGEGSRFTFTIPSVLPEPHG